MMVPDKSDFIRSLSVDYERIDNEPLFCPIIFSSLSLSRSLVENAFILVRVNLITLKHIWNCLANI